MEAFAAILLIPTIVFLVIVAPLWVILHYASKRKLTKQLSDDEHTQLDDLADHARDMAQRIETLEAILDATTPNWRQRSEEENA